MKNVNVICEKADVCLSKDKCMHKIAHVPIGYRFHSCDKNALPCNVAGVSVHCVECVDGVAVKKEVGADGNENKEG